MKRPTAWNRAFIAVSALCLVAAPNLTAQTAPSPDTTVEEDEPIVLSPFVVDASEDTGSYRATSTLAGTRVRTDLKDVASSISVVTKQFLEDTGAKKTEDLLVYTTNTEVGGLRGNFSGAGGGATYNEAGNLLRPSNNTRVRGLDSADNTRDYFLTEIPWDGYNVDRVDLQRGPNSILFGVGSPAGIINTSLNSAGFKNSNKIENRFDQYGSLRNSADFNYVILKNELAVRVALLEDRTKYKQEPAFNNDRRAYAAVRYAPKIFGEGNNTLIRVNYEYGDVKANRPRSLPPIDGITPWFTYGNKILLDPNKDNGAAFLAANPADPRTGHRPIFNESFLGRQYGPTLAVHFDQPDSGAVSRALQAEYVTKFGRNAAGDIDGSINGIPFFRYFAMNGYNAYQRALGTPGGEYYVNKSMEDPSIYDFFNNLIDGPNKREWQNWKSSNISIAQTFFDDRVGAEFVYDYQRYEDGQVGFLGGDQFIIGVDINTHLIGGAANPNVGRPFVSNNSQYGNTSTAIDRDSMRFTLTGELRAEDVMGKSRLAEILGRHVFTGLVSNDIKREERRGWTQFATEPLYSELLADTASPITDNGRQINWITYLGDSLVSRTSAAGANISPITALQVPTENLNATYFDSRWSAPAGVAFDAPYSYPDWTNDPTGTTMVTSTQSENPANYGGWKTRAVRILNADKGDIDALYSDGTKSRNAINSRGVTWQGYFWDGTFVPVFGWRRDEITNAASSAPKDALQIANMNYEVDRSEANTKRAAGESRSWGGVLHTPKSIIEKMPFGTNISLFYNRSENFKADAPRGDIFGNIIANPSGRTKDYGIVINTLNDKVSLKINWYETEVANATLAADNAGFAGSLYYVWAVPAWEATFAMANLEGINGRNDANRWYWNYAAQAAGVDAYDSAWNWDTANFQNSPATTLQKAAINDFFQNFPLPTSFFDAYGIAIDVSKFKSSNPVSAWPGYDPGNLAIQPAFQGRLRSTGASPVASVDTVSKGVEFELSAQPTKNWNITVNASKTEASRVALSPTITDFMEKYTAFLAGPAGDLRLWGTDPNNSFRNYWKNNIVAPYSVLKNQQGSAAPEIAPWRFNAVSTFSFNEGKLRGAYVGGAYRWEDKRILGYKYSTTLATLDISQPWYGPSDDHIDIWLGYSRKLTTKINWRVQLNVRNVGESTRLVPVSLQPDGTPGLSRIQEGMVWQLTNTFMF